MPPEIAKRLKKLALLVLVLAGLGAGGLVLFWAGLGVPCLFHTVTGLYCPGCGSTRCLHALVHLDLPGAMAMNPLLVVSILPMLVLALHGAGLWPAKLGGLVRLFARPIPWMVVIFVYWIARNLPWHPFNLLAPG